MGDAFEAANLPSQGRPGRKSKEIGLIKVIKKKASGRTLALSMLSSKQTGDGILICPYRNAELDEFGEASVPSLDLDSPSCHCIKPHQVTRRTRSWLNACRTPRGRGWSLPMGESQQILGDAEISRNQLKSAEISRNQQNHWNILKPSEKIIEFSTSGIMVCLRLDIDLCHLLPAIWCRWLCQLGLSNWPSHTKSVDKPGTMSPIWCSPFREIFWRST